MCVLEVGQQNIFQKLYLKKYLIYKAKISHQSVYIIKLGTIKFICKLVTVEQKMVRNLMIWNQITQETNINHKVPKIQNISKKKRQNYEQKQILLQS